MRRSTPSIQSHHQSFLVIVMVQIQKVWFITGEPCCHVFIRAIANLVNEGTSSGFGKRLVASVLNRGDRVIATARSLENIQYLRSLPGANPCTLHLMRLDIADNMETIQKVVDDAFSVWGRIDVLVNNAGYGLKATIEEGG